MKTILTCTAALLLATASALPEIDLTPRRMTLASGLMERVYFSDGAHRYAITLDGETKVFAENDAALFRFGSFSQATMRLRKSPLQKPLPFDEESMKEYRKLAESFLPPAEARELEWQGTGVFQLRDWQSCRFVFAYRISGISYQDSVTFLTMPGQPQIVIHTGSQRKDFAVIAARADDMIRRWHEVLPGDEAGAN